MHLPPIDMNVPSDQKYRATGMRTQITQQVKSLGCTCFNAFEERRMRQWREEQGDTKQATGPPTKASIVYCFCDGCNGEDGPRYTTDV